MPLPTPASIELAKTILGSDGNPFLEYSALAIGQVMQLNYSGVMDIFNDYRGEFETLGASDLLEKIEDRVDELFLSFIHEDDEAGE